MSLVTGRGIWWVVTPWDSAPGTLSVSPSFSILRPAALQRGPRALPLCWCHLETLPLSMANARRWRGYQTPWRGITPEALSTPICREMGVCYLHNGSVWPWQGRLGSFLCFRLWNRTRLQLRMLTPAYPNRRCPLWAALPDLVSALWHPLLARHLRIMVKISWSDFF